MDSSKLDAAHRRHEGVRIKRCLYPPKLRDVKKTVVFEAVDGRRYRLEPEQNFYRPHALGHGVGVHERLGGIDLYHTYTLWLREITRDKRGQPLHHIAYAQATPDTLSRGLLADMLKAHDLSPKRLGDWGGQDDADFEWPAIRKYLCGDKIPPRSMAILFASVPYFRMCLSARLFRLFPQSALMLLPPKQFRAVSCRIMRAGSAADARSLVVGFCCAWLQEEPQLPILGLEGLLALQRQYRLPETCGLNDAAWRTLMVTVDFFQKACARNKRNGHTFATLRQLACCYKEAADYDDRTQPGLQHILHEKRPVTRDELSEIARAHAHDAIRLGMVKARAVPIDEQGPRVSRNMQRVFYAADDWLMQEYCAAAINELARKRWRHVPHADGCRTEADVLARIKSASPPHAGMQAPQWHARDFQKRWALLDERQRAALVNAVLHPVTFVTGAPGTGKTELFACLRALFPPADSIALAAYGRIAKMLNERVGNAYTVHRAEATAEHRRGTDAATLLCDAHNAFFDEFGVLTHEHLTRFFHEVGQKKTRLLLAGDVHQMGAIGSGSFVGSLYRRFGSQPQLFTELNIPHRFLPNYGAGTTEAELRAMCSHRPESAADPLAVAWNMQQMCQYPRTRRLDLIVGDTPDDRFVIVPEGATVDGTLAHLERFGIRPRDLLDLRHQMLVHTNKMRRDVNYAVRSRFPQFPKSPHHFAVGEKITFRRNKYFDAPEDTNGSGGGGGGGGGQDLAIDYTAIRASRGAKRPRETDAESEQAPPPNKKGKNAKKRVSQNVFNGDIRLIETIYDQNAKGERVQDLGNTQQKRAREASASRVICFHDRAMLELDQYDAQNIESGIALTATNFQGSEVDIVIYWHKDSPHVRRDQLYTSMTRAKRQFIWIGGRTREEALYNIEHVVAADPPTRRERFAYHLNLPDSS